MAVDHAGDRGGWAMGLLLAQVAHQQGDARVVGGNGRELGWIAQPQQFRIGLLQQLLGDVLTNAPLAR